MKPFLPFVLLILLAACHSQKGPLTVHDLEAPAGTMRLGDNFFADRTEITNFSWLEYMFHTARVYGKGSPEYLATLPDTNVWFDPSLDISFQHRNNWRDFYLRHPVYRNYPVVGVTYDQAKAYAQWRSDRVLEYVLVREKYIKWVPALHPDSLFTIEKYFTGQYLGYLPEPGWKFYPEYRLPDKAQWRKLDSLAMDLQVNWAKKYGRRTGRNSEAYREVYNWKHDTVDVFIDPLVPVENEGMNKKPYLWHVRGNVRELGAEKGISYGGSWKDSINTIPETKNYPAAHPNAWTGFRNVCQWKTWE